MSIIELEHVSYAYPGNAIPILKDVTCRISHAELVVLSGNNGSGKSTFAKLIAGMIEPDLGTIHRKRDDSSGWNGIGLVMQDPSSQLLTASVEDEIAWGLENLCLGREEIERKVNDTLEQFGLTHLRNVPPEALSDGECQMTAFAANYVMEPDLLIFDESAAYLDLRWRKRIWEAARNAARRCGVIWITTRDYNLPGVSMIWRLENGKIDVN